MKNAMCTEVGAKGGFTKRELGSGAMGGEIDGWMHGTVRIVLRGKGLRRISISMSMAISLVLLVMGHDRD